jgi:hypothetical protein
LADELTKLQDIFHQNGYPPQLVHRILFSDSDPPKKEEIDLNNTLYGPKAKQMFKSIQEKFNFPIMYKKTQTLGQILKKTSKTRHTLAEKGIIYRFVC